MSSSCVSLESVVILRIGEHVKGRLIAVKSRAAEPDVACSVRVPDLVVGPARWRTRREVPPGIRSRRIARVALGHRRTPRVIGESLDVPEVAVWPVDEDFAFPAESPCPLPMNRSYAGASAVVAPNASTVKTNAVTFVVFAGEPPSPPHRAILSTRLANDKYKKWMRLSSNI